ncbi:MAG: hypothetical protein V4649_08265 [Bacteroidota bacterium]
MKKLVFRSSFGGLYSGQNHIFMEIVPNGTFHLYSNVYDDGTVDKTSNFLNSPETVSADELKEIFKSDPLQNYYVGEVSQAEYKTLAEAITLMQADTSRFAGCCCDIPYSSLKVYFGTGSALFMNCDDQANDRVRSLMRKFEEIANRKGYKHARAKFAIE